MRREISAQQTFRVLMQAMSHPGTIHQLEPWDRAAPYMTVLFALLDHEVTFAAIGKGIDTRSITITTGSRETTVEEADYLLIPGGDSAGTILRAKRGDLRYPDRGATIVYLVRSLQRGTTRISLTGPGIPGEQSLALDGLSHREVLDIIVANAGFPLGIDCIFVDTMARTTAIPRSTRLEVT